MLNQNSEGFSSEILHFDHIADKTLKHSTDSNSVWQFPKLKQQLLPYALSFKSGIF